MLPPPNPLSQNFPLADGVTPLIEGQSLHPACAAGLLILHQSSFTHVRGLLTKSYGHRSLEATSLSASSMPGSFFLCLWAFPGLKLRTSDLSTSCGRSPLGPPLASPCLNSVPRYQVLLPYQEEGTSTEPALVFAFCSFSLPNLSTEEPRGLAVFFML